MNAKLLISAVVAALMLSSCHVHHVPAPQAHWHGGQRVAKPVASWHKAPRAPKPKAQRPAKHAPKPMAHNAPKRHH